MATHITRSIIHIDESKCDGCGLCASACAEGAIQIVDGKAKLVKEQYCDGLGACLGECPRGAIHIEERVAEAYDPDATAEHLRRLGRDPAAAYAHAQAAPGGPASHRAAQPRGCPGSAVQSFAPAASAPSLPCGCPGSAVQSFAPAPTAAATSQPSTLRQWPVQLTLVPPAAPFLQGADLLVTADCVPFAYGDYHADLLAGRAVVVACPKLDDAQAHADKLAALLTQSDLRSLTVAIMEVPCCRGLLRLVEQALAASGKDLPLEVVTIGIRGEKL